jgi:hypothetical protein
LSDKYQPCSNHFAFTVRPSEQAELAAAAARKGMSKAAYVRSRIPEVFDPAVPGRKWSSNPAERHRRNTSDQL